MVREEILRGITHDLNNRVLALMGVRELAEEGLDASLHALFGEEVSRLEEVTGLLRRLMEEPAAEEVMEAGPLLETVRALHERHAGLRRRPVAWRVAAGLPAVRADPVVAMRTLLGALAVAGHAAAGGEAARSPTLSARGDGGRLVVEIRPWPAGARVEGAGFEAAAAGDGLVVRFAAA